MSQEMIAGFGGFASRSAAPLPAVVAGPVPTERQILLDRFLERPSRILGHRDRIDPFRAYCIGLLMAGGPGTRKSCEPLAARVAPERATALHQALHHFVAKADWNDQAVLEAVRETVLPLAGPAPVWVLNEIVLPKKGNHSVGVAVQRVSPRRIENCQRVVSLWATGSADAARPGAGEALPLSIRLFLPAEWQDDPVRRAKAGIPDHVGVATPGQLALDAVREAVAAAVPRGLVTGTQGFGADPALRLGLAELGRPYLLPLAPDTVLEGAVRPATGASVRVPLTGTARDLARSIAGAHWLPFDDNGLTWGELPLAGGPAGGERLVALWAEGAPMPERFWVTNLPSDQVPAAIVQQAESAARVTAETRRLREEVGLAHFEGRGWRGFHHHATLCITAHAFLAWERAELARCAFHL